MAHLMVFVDFYNNHESTNTSKNEPSDKNLPQVRGLVFDFHHQCLFCSPSLFFIMNRNGLIVFLNERRTKFVQSVSPLSNLMYRFERIDS